MTQKQRMTEGRIYDPADGEIMQEQTACVRNMKEYNALGLGDEARMRELLPRMFAEAGEGTYIQPPFYANWGGKHVHLGRNVYANFHLTLVDDGHIFIGDRTMIGPNVTIVTGTHPVSPALRERGIQYNADVHIGKNVWLGAGATRPGEAPLCRWLGDLSYPLYITHFPFVLTYTAIVANAGWRSLAQAWPLALLTITLAIAFAWASARLYDAPLRRWLSRR